MITVEFKDLDEMMAFAKRLTGLADSGVPATSARTQTFTAVQNVPTSSPAQTQTVSTAMPVQSPVQPAPTQSGSALTAPISGVPTSTPGYTPDDLARAAMTLMDSGRQQELIGLLQSFGVSSLPDLRPDQYGAFATALRGMGAQI